MKQGTPQVSLLWPENAKPGQEPKKDLLAEHAGVDLGIHTLVERLSFRTHLREKLRAILSSPTSSAETIHYRQDILEDMLNNPALRTSFEELLPKLAHLGYLGEYPFHTFLEQVTTRLGELEVYVECVHLLKAALEDPQVSLRSVGLTRLRETVQALEADEAFRDLAAQLPDLRVKASGVVSISVGINLDNQLRPFEATLLSLNNEPYTGSRDNFLSRLFGSQGENGEFRGVARLHTILDDYPEVANRMIKQGERANPLILPLFSDLDQIMRRTMEPVARALQRYLHIQGRILMELEPELAFYLSGVWLIEQMRRAGLPMCRAEIAPIEERVFEVRDLYNLNLALQLADNQPDLKDVVVANDAFFGEEGRILILTGPNQGGKTTFTQAVGLAQVMFQIGYYLPGSRARISPVDGIFTHFPLEEKPQTGEGRLGEEAQRLNRIFQHATRHSLVLLNESLTTTSPGESIYLARDILRALRLWGVRAIFVTHLHELAENIEMLHESTSGDSRIASLVAGVSPGSETDGQAGDRRRTFVIRAAPPMGVSFARDIARRHGISFEQLEQGLRERNGDQGD